MGIYLSIFSLAAAGVAVGVALLLQNRYKSDPVSTTTRTLVNINMIVAIVVAVLVVILFIATLLMRR